MPVLLDRRPTLVPEVWMGHLQEGRGFRTGLERLTELVWAGQVLSRDADSRKRRELDLLTVPSSATVLAALQAIDRNRMGIAFVVDEHGTVVGVVTDGDIRHGFVRGSNLHSSIAEVMTRAFVFASVEMTAEEIRALLQGRTRVLPVVDSAGRLVDYASD